MSTKWGPIRVKRRGAGVVGFDSVAGFAGAAVEVAVGAVAVIVGAAVATVLVLFLLLVGAAVVGAALLFSAISAFVLPLDFELKILFIGSSMTHDFVDQVETNAGQKAWSRCCRR